LLDDIIKFDGQQKLSSKHSAKSLHTHMKFSAMFIIATTMLDQELIAYYY